MNVLSFEDASEDLDAVLRQVVDGRAPVAIARRRAEAVVMVAESEWNSMEETLRFHANPANAARLRESIAQLDAGEGVERDLIEP